MNNRLKSCVQRLDPAAIAFAAIPALLYLPVFYYSLNTPFGLIDDYLIWKFIQVFDWFAHWLYIEFLVFDYSYSQADIEWIGGPWENLRYRPFWEIYNAATWKVFGHNPWLHHLARWAAHFGGVAAFAAAFLCFHRRNGDGNGDRSASRRLILLLPLTALVYLWIFFPNQPAARLGTQGFLNVLFLGICVWMTALTLSRQGKPQTRRSALLIYAAFSIGFCGLAWTKEPNLIAELWLLLSYYALPLIAALRRQAGSRISAVRALKSVGVWRALGGLPLIAVFLHTLVIVYFIAQVEGYGRAPLTPDLFISNAAWLAATLFQVHTSLIITTGLALLSTALLLFVAVNIAKKRFSDELIFTLFLLGIFASLYLALCASWTQALRYSYILIPVFTALLAFSTKLILDFAAQFNIQFNNRPRNLTAYALTAFIAFFVCCNYYGFLYQTVGQRIARHNDANLLAEITRLLEQGQYVQVLDARYVHSKELITYFHEFLPLFYGRKYDLSAEPPQEAGRPHYIVRYTNVDMPETVKRLPKAEESYRPLAYAYRVSKALQTDGAYRAVDKGFSVSLWQIYDDKIDRIWLNGDVLDTRHIAETDKPLIQSDFDVYLKDGRLIYINEHCDESHIDDIFFLGAFPVDNYVLIESRRTFGFDNMDFDFADYGFGGPERCIAVRPLPEYPVEWIHTGQLIATEDGYHHTWEGEAVLSGE